MVATAAKQSAKKKSKKPAKPTAKAKAQHLDDKIAELESVQKIYGQSCLEWEEAHAHAGELKKTMEKNQARLNGVAADIVAIRSGNYTPPLPFGLDELAPEATGPDAWKAVPLSSLGLSPKVIEKLEDAGLRTLGALAAWTKPLTDVKGIGEAAAEKIEEATARYWKENPQQEEPGTTVLDEKAATPAEAA